MNSFLKSKLLGAFVKSKGMMSKPLFGGMGFMLCFHRIHSGEPLSLFPENSMSVHVAHFERIINHIRNCGIEIVNIDEALNRLKKKSGKKFCVITFDDGYSDNYTVGLPLFKKLDVPVCIYVNISLISGEMMLWWDRLEELIMKQPEISIQLNDERIACAITNLKDKQRVWWIIRDKIVGLENEISTEQLLQSLQWTEESCKSLTLNSALTEIQLKTLASEPLITIGAHSIRHVSLSRLTDEAAFTEINESKLILASIIGKPVNHFAYPYGAFNDCGLREFDLVKKAGYASGVTFMPSNLFNTSYNKRFSLGRYAAGNNLSNEKLDHIANGIRHFADNF